MLYPSTTNYNSEVQRTQEILKILKEERRVRTALDINI